MRILYFFLSFIYSLISRIRNLLFDLKILKTYKSSLPIICVGNLTVGGNGKTPFCIFLAKKFAHLNPVILSRGYRSRNSGVLVVNDEHSPEDVGDEAKMMFDAGFSVVIAPSRVLGVKWIEQNHLGNLIILDDGFQHRYLERDLNLVLVDGSTKKAIREFRKGSLLPFGRFRENKVSGSKRTDAIILSTRMQSRVSISHRVLGVPDNLPIFQSRIVKTKVFPMIDTTKKFIAVCAIANPEGFFKVLKELNLEILKYYVKRDHYHFTKEDIEKLKLAYPEAEIICTEKDAVKLRRFVNVYSLQIEVDVTPLSEFDSLIQTNLKL